MNTHNTVPTVELNHQHITTLRKIIDTPSTERKIARVHRQYLTGVYPRGRVGNATIDDLELTDTDLQTINAALTNARGHIPVDVYTHLMEEFGQYHQIMTRQASVNNNDDDTDSDILVCDGGRSIDKTVITIKNASDGARVGFEADGIQYTGVVDFTGHTIDDTIPEHIRAADVPDDRKPTPRNTETVMMIVKTDPGRGPYADVRVNITATRDIGGDWEAPTALYDWSGPSYIDLVDEVWIVERASGVVPRAVPPEVVAEMYHFDPDAFQELVESATERVLFLWETEKQSEYGILQKRTDWPDFIIETAQLEPNRYNMVTDHDLDTTKVIGAIADNFVTDVISEVCELVRKDHEMTKNF